MHKSLTNGNIAKSLLIFSLPIILGNLIQQLYNIVDTLIVGKIIGATALSAVGSSYSLMVLLTSVILGLCMGSGVVFAQIFGAGKTDELKTSIFNSFVFIMVVSFAINVISLLLLKKIIIWLNIPNEAVGFTFDYLKIIFVGLVFVSIYNFFASVLRSIGNTVVPLVFLAVSAVTNIILDIVFIVNFHMGVKGAAMATVISQMLSAVLIIIYFFIKAKNICPQKEHMHYDKKLLGMIVSNSSLTAIQQSIMNFGILTVHSLVNSFGFAVSAAFAAVVKIDAFAYMPAQDFGNAFSTFIAQNYGAKKQDRIHKGIWTAVKISLVFCLISSAFVCLFSKQLMLLFVKFNETEIINIGVKYLHIEGAWYVGIGILFLLYGFYRGLGKAGMSIILTVISLGSRVALAYILSASSMGVSGIWWAVPIGWALADVFGIVYYFVNRKNLTP